MAEVTGTARQMLGVDVKAVLSVREKLTRLCAAGCTGALHVGGTPGGVLYLVAGRLTHAESPGRPGVGERLVTSGRVAFGAWQAAYAEGFAACRVARVLVRDGCLGEPELARRVLATVRDVTHVLLRDDAAQTRFVPGERHWLGSIPRLDVSGAQQDAHRVRLVGATPLQDGLR
jgi:hypothetical protein